MLGACASVPTVVPWQVAMLIAAGSAGFSMLVGFGVVPVADRKRRAKLRGLLWAALPRPPARVLRRDEGELRVADLSGLYRDERLDLRELHLTRGRGALWARAAADGQGLMRAVAALLVLVAACACLGLTGAGELSVDRLLDRNAESAYAGRDHTLAYQYAPQGVPRLALRRTPPGDDGRMKTFTAPTFGFGVDADGVAILDQSDRAALGRLGADMADAEAAGGAGEAPIGDQCHLLAHAEAIERSGGREHLAHAGAALGAFVADDDHFALYDLAVLDGLECLFLAIEHPRRAGELEPVHARDLHDRALRCQRAAQADHPARRRKRRLDVIDDLLVGVPRDLIYILAQRLAGHRLAIAIEEAAGEHRLHQHVDPAGFVHILGDILATGFQVRDVRR